MTWIEILFAQGVTTFEAFTGGISSDDIARPAPPPMLVARFQHAIGEATALAERQRALADSADAHYQIGATAALSALYRSTVEGSSLRALTDGRRAASAIERARAREPRRRETGLVLGPVASQINGTQTRSRRHSPIPSTASTNPRPGVRTRARGELVGHVQLIPFLAGAWRSIICARITRRRFGKPSPRPWSATRTWTMSCAIC